MPQLIFKLSDTLTAFITPRIAAIGATVTVIVLHKYNLRGDTAVGVCFLLFSVIASLFSLAHHGFLYSSFRAALFLASHFATLCLVTITYRLSPLHPLESFPGPLLNKISSLPAAYMVYTGKRHLRIKQLHDKYGAIVRTGPNSVSINAFSAIAPIYSSSQCMDKSEAYRPGRFDQAGLFFIRGKEKHNQRRRVWAAAFTAASLANAREVITRRTNELVECMDRRRSKSGNIDLTSCIQHWSYDVMGDITFGGSSRIELMQDNDKYGLVSSGQKATIAFEVLGEMPALFDIMWYLPVTKDVHALERLAQSLVASRRLSEETTSDISSHLLGSNLNDAELNLDTLFAIQAGSDTTSGVLTLLLYHVLSNRAVYEKLSAELDATFPDKIIGSSHDDLTSMPYLNAVVNEGLRLGTPFPGLPRVVPRGGAYLSGTYIPEGTTVAVPAFTQQVNPENFSPFPLEFRPERWLPGGLGPNSILNKSAVMCFSYGPFGCLGKTLAIQELHLVAAKLLLEFDITLAPSFRHAYFEENVVNMRTTVFRQPLLVQATSRVNTDT
ncbi:cytochrome P450 [Hysterangium stoloniferum]|nr:cytochrome P450 [Hysterangium stoloniferum]